MNVSNALSISGVHESSGIPRSIPSDVETTMEGGVTFCGTITNDCVVADILKPGIPPGSTCPTSCSNSGVMAAGIPVGGKNYNKFVFRLPSKHTGAKCSNISSKCNSVIIAIPLPYCSARLLRIFAKAQTNGSILRFHISLAH